MVFENLFLGSDGMHGLVFMLFMLSVLEMVSSRVRYECCICTTIWEKWKGRNSIVAIESYLDYFPKDLKGRSLSESGFEDRYPDLSVGILVLSYTTSIFVCTEYIYR